MAVLRGVFAIMHEIRACAEQRDVTCPALTVAAARDKSHGAKGERL
jgi:hypothetical protein